MPDQTPKGPEQLRYQPPRGDDGPPAAGQPGAIGQPGDASESGGSGQPPGGGQPPQPGATGPEQSGAHQPIPERQPVSVPGQAQAAGRSPGHGHARGRWADHLPAGQPLPGQAVPSGQAASAAVQRSQPGWSLHPWNSGRAAPQQTPARATSPDAGARASRPAGDAPPPSWPPAWQTGDPPPPSAPPQGGGPVSPPPAAQRPPAAAPRSAVRPDPAAPPPPQAPRPPQEVIPRSAARESRPAEARGILGQPIGIRVDGVSRIFKTGEVETAALQDVTFDIAPGEFVAVTGPSGCGKTTLLNLLGGLDRPTAGRALVAGVPLDQLPGGGLDDYRLLRVGTVFQFFNLVPTMTAEDNVAMPMTLAGVPERDRRRRARWLLGLVGLDHRARFLPGRLAGGEQQRVAIARALANQPGLLLADEPTGNLDSATGDQVLQLLRDLNRRGATVVLVTHDPEVARRADRAVRLRDGRVFSDSGSSRMTARAPLQAQTPTRLGAGDAFRLGLRDVGRRKLRTAVTSGGATLGIALAALILSLKAGGASPLPYSFLALVSLIVASFGIINNMFTSLANRRKEIGTFKALGARSRDVLILFLAEATIVGVSAAILGPALAFALALVGNLVTAAGTFMLSPAVLLVSVGLALLVTLLSGTLPALRAARMDPAAALRGE